MKKIVLFLLFIFMSLNSYAQTYKITCTYNYETYTSPEELKGSFTVVGKVISPDQVVFNTVINKLPAYFFPEDQYGALWHKDSSLIFTATLTGERLNYAYQFNNYLRSFNEFKTVFRELRYIDVDLEKKKNSFDYDEGILISAAINTDPWINEDQILLDSCTLEIK